MLENTLETEIEAPSLIDRLHSFQFKMTRRLLHAWIRPNVLGCSTDYLEIEADDLVCYVLHSRSIGDLLVLDHACEEGLLPRPIDSIANIESRSFFFLGHSEGTLGRKTQREQSERMQRLLQHQKSNDRSIKIVPVSLFWGHQPDKEKSIFKLILSENWTVTSRLKKIFAGLFHPSHILVQFGKAIDLSKLIETEPAEEKQKRKLLRLLRVQFTNQKQAIIGPDLSHRRTLINSMMESSSLEAAIDLEIKTSNQSRQKVEKKAHTYAQEIAADQSYRVIRFFVVVLTWLWNKLYDGIVLSQIDTAKELAKSYEIVYIPCHRSHIDYLLLSYVLYNNGLTPPHIAAGKNLNLPILGPLLRRGGAFFMRRSFRDNPLYKSVFDEYLNLMFNRGYSVEYFIEGGRSRTGRTLSPKTGMLSMTIRSFRRNSTKPIVFLPVYFGYERILEASTYLGELSGKTKEKESLFDLFGVLRTLKESFGKVSVNFGEALFLTDFLNEHQAGWQDEDIDYDSIAENEKVSKTSRLLATTLAGGINNAVAITPINLVATAILCTPKQTIELHRLERQVDILQSLATQTSLSKVMTITNQDSTSIIQHAIKVTGLDRISTADFGDIIQATPRTASLLTYYANNSLHVFALSSLIARIVVIKKRCLDSDIIEACNVLHPYLKAELFFSWSMDDVKEKCLRTIETMTSLELLTLDGKEYSTPCPTTDLYASLIDLAEIIEPSLERFFIVCTLLDDDKAFSSVELEKAASGIAQHLSRIYGINSPEFFDQPLFTRFISTMDNEGCIESTNDIISTHKSFDLIKQNSESFLNNHVRYNVNQAMQHFHRTAS
ncbi:MAG: glycerol-3-phosphate O-acyltransferase [Candidatus Azotimanducaceae bacterium]|jgi:glycerol-3-phosphate O-acyltransferase